VCLAFFAHGKAAGYGFDVAHIAETQRRPIFVDSDFTHGLEPQIAQRFLYWRFLKVFGICLVEQVSQLS
jgi:hypothetical protein